MITLNKKLNELNKKLANKTTATKTTESETTAPTDTRHFAPAPFNPPMWLSNAHIQTILPKFVAPETPSYRRELQPDLAGLSEVAYDFIDADEPKPSEGELYKAPLVVLFHGMEGSSDSHYARSLGHMVQAQGWHFVVAHFQTCGGVPMRDDVVYHAGNSLETHYMLSFLASRYQTIHAVGVSLGGNFLAKYMGDYNDEALCDSASVISAPVDLVSATFAFETFIGRNVYTPYLLNPMLNKVLHQQLDIDELVKIEATKRIAEFDEAFTVKRLGYRSPYDYYRKASALPHLYKITKPTLMISAKDDPFLGVTATEADVSDSVTLYKPAHGGHIGFVRFKGKHFDINWIPENIIDFINHLDGSKPTESA